MWVEIHHWIAIIYKSKAWKKSEVKAANKSKARKKIMLQSGNCFPWFEKYWLCYARFRVWAPWLTGNKKFTSLLLDKSPVIFLPLANETWLLLFLEGLQILLPHSVWEGYSFLLRGNFNVLTLNRSLGLWQSSTYKCICLCCRSSFLSSSWCSSRDCWSCLRLICQKKCSSFHLLISNLDGEWIPGTFWRTVSKIGDRRMTAWQLPLI